ncbi:MAG: hypothetical protein ACKVXR_06545 [Planctomycetota bacterium]
MDHQDSNTFDRWMDAVEAAIRLDPVLSGELRASGPDFFQGGDAPLANEASGPAERRHLEWFLIERSNPPSQQLRIASLLERCALESSVDPDESKTALEGSHASLFEVTAVEAGGTLRLEDLAGSFECSAVAAENQPALAVGDLVAGRVYPIGERTHLVSPAASTWRNASLLAAVRADFERARAQRTPASGQRSTLGQSEIEAILRTWTRKALAGRTRRGGAVALARELFLENGLSPEDADEFLEWLSSEAPDPTKVLPGGDDVLRDVLDTLAFETSVDLDAARAVLIDAWDEMHTVAREPSQQVPRSPDPGAPRADVATAIAEFDRKRREGTPLDQAIRDLEHDLDLEGSESGEELEDEEESAPELPGVVGGVVEEFLWEEELVHGAGRAKRYQVLRGLGASAERVGNLEDLGRRDLTDFACRRVIESGALRDAEDAEILLEGLERFCRWAEENHDVPLQSEFGPILERLRHSLPRVALANRACAAGVGTSGSEWLELVERLGASEALLCNIPGRQTKAELSSAVLEHLRPGDWVRGRSSEARGFAVEACYPSEIRELLQA